MSASHRLAAALLALVAVGAQAQDAASIEQASYVRGDVAAEATAVGLTPAEALALTVGPVAPSANVLALVQDGADNAAAIRQIGQENRFALVQQGQGNTVDADILGSGNTSNVTQFGDDNQYQLVMTTDDVTLLPVLQVGDRNEATQIVAPGLQPAGIEQIGDDLQIIVERNF